MPFGAVTQKLGIANPRIINASSFAQTVLRLPAGFPIYQQMLVHAQGNLYLLHGPCAGAEWGCDLGPGADDEIGNTTTIREISACDTKFARRNLAESSNPSYRLTTHRLQYANQIYYVLNEPEDGSKLNPNPQTPAQGFQQFDICDCMDPRDRAIDNHVSSCFQDPDNEFWEPASGSAINCGLGESKRIRAKALAFLYLRLRRETEVELGQGHIVIPPAPAPGDLGVGEPYIEEFYDYIHDVQNGVTIGSCTEDGVQTAAIHALNIHRYSEDPVTNPEILSPLFSVAFDASVIRSGVVWYFNRYDSIGKLSTNILLSEMGYKWNLDGIPRVWAGGWTDFREGLSWWNSYLCWLTRLAAYECNLADGLDLHACPQVPESPPYTTASDTAAGADTTERNQFYLSVNNMSVQTLYLQPALQIDALTDGEQAGDPGGNPYPGVQTYRNSFLKYRNGTSFQNKTWRTTPFGACYTTWAAIGSDPASPSNDLNLGWVEAPSGVTGVVATASISLQEGFNTVYFPVIKDPGTFDPLQNHQVQFRWVRNDRVDINHGYMALNEFEDTTTFPTLGNQIGYSAMIYPVVCHSHPDSQITVELSRNIAGPKIWLGRPIVLPVICSWFLEQ